MNPLLYWHTVRHLKWTQMSGRLRRRYRRLNLCSPADIGVREPARPLAALRWRDCALHGADEFEFLNARRAIAGATDWNAPDAAKLWLYNLHYFDWINARPATANSAPCVLAWISRWIAQNPAPFGNGWEPYPLSLRIVNWIKWLSANTGIDATVHTQIAASLAQQAHVLAQRIETHLLGNHLFANAKGLMFAGSFFAGEAAECWFATGARILGEELNEQVMADGAYFELSPMYHTIVLEDLLDLLGLQQAFPHAPWARFDLTAERLTRTSRAMLDWLGRLTHRDGNIALFNDAAHSVAAPPASLRAHACSLGVCAQAPLAADASAADGIEWLKPSGFVRIDRGLSTAILDVGKVGPDYLPGHAHADTLSFEWSIGPERVVVDSGTSLYADGAERLRQRGTAAHNTVVVDDTDSSEVWAQFRVARRAYPMDVRVDASGQEWIVEAAHDGYRRLAGNVVHRRRWTHGANRLVVADRLEGRFKLAQARLHLHPGVCVDSHSGPRLRLRLQSGRQVALHAIGGVLRVEDATYHPEFGRSIPNRCVVLDIENRACEVTFSF